MRYTPEDLAIFPPLGRALERLQATRLCLDLCFPTQCCSCGIEGSLLCSACMSQVKRIDAAQACPRCGAPFGALVCTECSTKPTQDLGADRVAVATLFSEITSAVVRTYKDKYDRRLALVIANFLTEAFFAHGFDCLPIQAITTIAPRPQNLRRRGFDHAALIARALSHRLSLPYLKFLHVSAVKDQRGLSRDQRSKNMAQAFIFDQGAAIYHAEHILLIDDVITTGATVRSAVSVLKEVGGLKVYVLVFARAYGGGDEGAW